MAKGYWNVAGSITNPAGMRAYLAAAEPYLAKCGARFLCRDLDTDVREGDPGHLTVIIEFESLLLLRQPMRLLNIRRSASFASPIAMFPCPSLKRVITLGIRTHPPEGFFCYCWLLV